MRSAFLFPCRSLQIDQKVWPFCQATLEAASLSSTEVTARGGGDNHKMSLHPTKRVPEEGKSQPRFRDKYKADAAPWRHKEALEEIIRFCFQEDRLQHPQAVGRLFAYAIYGPLDAKARLRSGQGVSAL
jgi:hypothetical protein